MGSDSRVRPVYFSPNGLFPNEEAWVTQALDPERWLQAEGRTAELIAHIQPNQTSVDHRNAVANYVQCLIKKCLQCDVFTFGSVPFKTYLTDGDIDLTAVSMIQDLKDTWASMVCDILEQEAKSEDAEFHVKDVLYIGAEVKIIKCIIDNFVVDISFNKLGGLSTLCFLDEVDRLINQNHLYKRSIILIKAWCYYEGRILGASHALISTYALEILVLYVFIVFNNSFAGPLEVLYRFLELFSKFDWDNFCVSLWGPVPCSSLPDMTVEPPRNDDEELFLSKMLHDMCSLVNDVLPRGQENQGQPFVCKYFNIIDPLSRNNNLGRSVSKGNRSRICTAFAFGAQQLARLLVCPHENLMAEVDQFFKDTWSRHGYCPNASSLDRCGLQSINLGQIDGCGSTKKYSGSKKAKEDFTIHETGVDMTHSFDISNYVASQSDDNSLEHPRTSGSIYTVSHSKGKKSYASIVSSTASDKNFQVSQNINTGANTLAVEGRSRRQANEVQVEYVFARTCSSSETETSKEVSSQGKYNTEPETGNRHISSYASRINLVPAASAARFSTEDAPSSRQSSSSWNIDTAVDSNNFSSNYFDEFVSDAMAQGYFISQTKHMHREEMTGSIDSELVAVDSNQDNGNGRYNGLQPIQYVYPAKGSGCHTRSFQAQQQVTSVLSNSVHSSQISSSDIIMLKDHELMKEGMGYVNNCHTNGANSVATTRLKHAFQDTSLRTKLSSDSYCGRSRSKTLTSIKDEGGKLPAPSTNLSTAHRLGVAGKQHEKESLDDSCQEGDGNRKQIPHSTVCPESDENMICEMFLSLNVQSNGIRGHEPAPMIGSHSVIPVGSKPQHQATNNPGNLPFSLYPTGPPFPFLSMLPVYNLPADEFNHFQNNVLDCSLDSNDNCNQLKGLYGSSSMVDCASADPSENHMSDILNSDSTSHWENLQYLRFCQDARRYPSPVLPSTYSHRYSPSEDPVATSAENMKLINQLTHCGPHVIPLSPLQPSFSRHAGLCQDCSDKIPRYHGVTELNLHHSPISSVGCQYSNARNHRGDYGYGMKGYHVYNEGSWNISSKPKYAGCYPDFTQVEMPGMRMNWGMVNNSQSKKPFVSIRHYSLALNYLPYGSSSFSGSTGHDSVNAPYGMHPVSILDKASESGTGALLYSYDQLMSYAAPSEHLEFKPLGPEFFLGVDEASYLSEISRSGIIEPQDMEGDSKFSSANLPFSRQGPRSRKKRTQKKDLR